QPKFSGVTRVFKCCHTDDQAEEELNCCVDLGGTVLDVFVNHKVYGRLRADMNIRSRKDVKIYVEEIRSGKSTPLKNVTSDYHYHTVAAESQEDLDLIEAELKSRGFLVSPKSSALTS
ncbi:MAG: DNA-binding transcriptional regulator, partial [Eubacterium sp.]|nr:DNA-binding transcriptional regulator [Eubacterium sp.]